jgi:hypothetical protein
MVLQSLHNRPQVRTATRLLRTALTRERQRWADADVPVAGAKEVSYA